jgi:hypothetical protein
MDLPRRHICRSSEVEEHLERSKNLPLDVTISIRLPEEELLEGYKKPIYVLHHLKRIESLEVTGEAFCLASFQNVTQ